MTKMETMKEILQINNSNILLQLPTSFGKTRFSLEILKKRNPKNILIVVPRLVLINNWKDEMTKWGCKEVIKNTVFTTYVSLPKHAGSWDMIIFDEVQHLSERCMNALDSFTIKYSVLLSATVKRELLYELK